MYGYIYITTNLINGKRYIGQHKCSHFDFENYKGSGKALSNAFKKYRKENFKCELLKSINNIPTICNNKDELNISEKYYIEYYNCVNDPLYYNLTKGGRGGDTLSLRTEAENLNRRQKLKAYWKNKENIAKRNQKALHTWNQKTKEQLTQFRKNHSHFLYSPTNNLSEKLVLSECARKYNVSLQTPWNSACLGGKIIKKLGFGFIRISI